uniref:Uncharacterized protein n=1 Tax=Mustela putorius furo TaxID=9669 RepID=M3YWY1_MUSPF
RSVWLSLFCDFDLGLNATTSERRAFLLEPILRLASSLPTPVLFGWFVSRTRDSGQQTESWVCPFPASEPGHVLDPSPRPFPPLSSGDVRPSLASFLQGPLRGRRNTGWKGVLERRSVVRRWPDGFMMSEDSSGPDRHTWCLRVADANGRTWVPASPSGSDLPTGLDCSPLSEGAFNSACSPNNSNCYDRTSRQG